MELLNEQVDKLNRENTKLKETISNLYNLMGYDICQYFYRTNSIRKTAQQFYFNSIKDCYNTLIDFNDDEYVVNKANDFSECLEEIFGKKTHE